MDRVACFAACFAAVATAFGCSSSVDDQSGAGGSKSSASSSSSSASHASSGGTSTHATVVAATTGGPVATVGAGGGGAGGMDLSNTPCNPVLGCGMGFDCDVGENDDFECFASDMSDADVCQQCDEMMGPYCKDGTTCLPSGECSRYCCDDADCAGGTCDLTLYIDLGYLDDMHGVGVCVIGGGGASSASSSSASSGAGGASGGASGGAGGGALDGLMCAPDAPVASPSNGACYKQ